MVGSIHVCSGILDVIKMKGPKVCTSLLGWARGEYLFPVVASISVYYAVAKAQRGDGQPLGAIFPFQRIALLAHGTLE